MARSESLEIQIEFMENTIEQLDNALWFQLFELLEITRD